MKKILTGIISGYQKLSRSAKHYGFFGLAPGICKFHPSCSEYAIMAINKYGAVKGVSKGISRIAMCNPLTKGGVDLP